VDEGSRQGTEDPREARDLTVAQEPEKPEFPEVIVVTVEKGNAPAMISTDRPNAQKMDTYGEQE
jgi:hypothetical protein